MINAIAIKPLTKFSLFKGKITELHLNRCCKKLKATLHQWLSISILNDVTNYVSFSWLIFYNGKFINNMRRSSKFIDNE